MRIGLNLLHALPEIGGAWNYIDCLLQALGEADSKNTYIGFVTRHSECLLPIQPNFQKIMIRLRSESRSRRVLYENSILPARAYQANLDCLHWFAGVQALFNTVPSLVTVYDLQPLSNTSDFSWGKRVYLHKMMRVASKRASMLLPISNATSTAMQLELGSDPSRISVIPCPLNSRFKPSSERDVAEFRDRYRLPAQFWLYVAHTYPHKNHVRLLHAYHQLKCNSRTPWPLVLRGDDRSAKPDIDRAIAQLGLEQDVMFLPSLPGSNIPLLYSSASALIFPSLYEGLGIPILEAMACGCPVIASHIGAVQEVAGNVPVYFDPLDVNAIESAMWAFQSNEEERRRSKQLGLLRAEQFQPSMIVGKLLAAYGAVGRTKAIKN